MISRVLAVVVVSVTILTSFGQTSEVCGMNSNSFPDIFNIQPNINIDNGLKKGILTSTCSNILPNLLDDDDRIIFVPSSMFQNGLSCGACINVTATQFGTTSTFKVSDQVFSQQLEISANQYNLLGNGQDIQSMTWSVVPCPASITGADLSFSFTAGSTQLYAALIIYSSTPVYAVQVVRHDTLVSLSRVSGAWTLPQGNQQVPFNVTVTSITGDSVEFPINVILSNATEIVQTNVQFLPSCEEVVGVTFPPTGSPPTTGSVVGETPTTTVKGVSGASNVTYMFAALIVLMFF